MILREMNDPALALSSFREGMKALDTMSKTRQVPMSEYGKLLCWIADIQKRAFAEQIERDKAAGYKVVEHYWCGEPYSTFAVPSLGIFAIDQKAVDNETAKVR